jgi:ribosome maturation factor RimP
VAKSYGLEIFDVQLRREPIGMVLRVVIDRPDTGAVEGPDDGVGIEECQRVSQDLSALLDVEDEFGQLELEDSYTLEVSSPGLDRPLRHEADFRRFAGRLAKLVTTEPIERQSAFAGRLRGVEDGVVVLEEGRKTHRVPLARIKRAHLDVEF